MEINTINAISPIDGRYRKQVEEISKYVSEYAYIKYRVKVEVLWLKYILSDSRITDCNIELSVLDKVYENFSIKDAMRVKEIEKKTNHDVKAIEYYVREKIEKLGLEEYVSFVHFACTSEDINNVAHALMLKESMKNVVIPAMKELIECVRAVAKEKADVPFLAHTHGQPATPTTIGKELAVFVYRWNSLLDKILNIKLKAKFSGAVGNFSAHKIAYPNIDWLEYNKAFINSLGLEFNPLPIQIESHDTMCELFSYIKLFNNVTLDFNSDMWMYISYGYFKQKVVATETGSSVMPHKVNPINHENSMANIHMSNSIIDNFTSYLQVSRMQRDLSDSSNLRNIGVMLSHTLISLKQSLIAFGKMELNEKVINEELDNNPEVLSEAIQTILRKNKVKDAYEKLKELTRGKEVTLDGIREYIKTLNIPNEDKEALLNLTPKNYIGLSSELVELI